ncbi:carbohydrate kinase family protein [Salinigranum halophilum]|jgi:ribokinase|uniref:carbohydrate kinase family protein n=1 Tax=Salinigranum halophilum TaxID=2565931 RepID=UPI00115DB6D7|nr:carbohydrate kinase family protein [Salinigranum halophilum]
MPRVICAGHVNWDVTMHVDDLPAPDGEAQVREVRAAGGGSAANVACGLVGLRLDAALLGSVGGDSYGTEARHELAAAGVDTTGVQVVSDRPTAVKYIAVDDAGEVMVFGCEGANEAFDTDALSVESIDGADHLHLTGQSPETARRLATLARDLGLTVSVDPGRLVGARDFDAVLDLVDVLFLNDREAAVALADGETDPTAEGRLAVRDGRAVVVKHGPDGAEVRTGGERYTHAGFDVDAVDTTGAGDAFAAGYLAATLDGTDADDALAVANACGALAAETRGARATLSWDAVASMRVRRGQ